MSAELFEAIERHDLKRLAELLVQGADPSAGHDDCDEWVPLKAAIEEISEGGSVDAVVLLLRYGAAVDGTGKPGDSTPLVVAALNKQLDAARILLGAGANPSAIDREGDTPRYLSVRNKHSEMIALLELCGATIEENS